MSMSCGVRAVASGSTNRNEHTGALEACTADQHEVLLRVWLSEEQQHSRARTRLKRKSEVWLCRDPGDAFHREMGERQEETVRKHSHFQVFQIRTADPELPQKCS